MSIIPPEALRRLKKLRRLADQQHAVYRSLGDDVIHEEGELSRFRIAFHRSDTWGALDVDQDGRAVRAVTNEALINGRDGQVTRQFRTSFVRVPELDHLAQPIHATTQRIAALKAEAAEAGPRAGIFLGAVRRCERALEARGWRGDR